MIVADVSPYCHLEEVLPFNDFGWYENGEVMEYLFQLYPITSVIEVGSFMGKSTRHIASCLPEEGILFAIDHWKGSEEHQEGGRFHDPIPIPLSQLYNSFLSNMIHAHLTHKVVPIQMDSLKAAASLPIKADLIYIDSAHDVFSVYQDLIAWYPHLNPHGILCGDDWYWETVQAAVYIFSLQHPELHLHTYQNFYCFLPRQ